MPTGPAISRPLLLGHRGARSIRKIRENTLESFDRALADGCDGFEFDVRLTADQQAVIWHDPKSQKQMIARSRAAELRQLADLADVLARYQDTAFLDVELKVPGAERITVDLLRKFPPRRGFVVSSFLPGVLKEVHALDESISLGLICETTAELSHWPHIAIEYVIPQHPLATPALIHELKAAGKKIVVWTVNTAAAMVRFRDLAVDGIVSDQTSLLCRTLQDRS